jgi:hypothetical protein
MHIDTATDTFALTHNADGILAAVLKGRQLHVMGAFGRFVGWERVPLPRGVGEVVAVGASGPSLLTQAGELFVWQSSERRWSRVGNLFKPTAPRKRTQRRASR